MGLSHPLICKVCEVDMSQNGCPRPPPWCRFRYTMSHKSCFKGIFKRRKKSGCFGGFNLFAASFLREMKCEVFCCVPFRGNRLSIMFFNGGHVYFLHKQMIQHLNSQPGLNKLLKSVQKDLGTPLYIAGCKALGLISIFLTTTL